MAKGKKTGGRDFAKGNPGGKWSQLSAIEREARNATRQQIAESIEKISKLNYKDLKLFCKNESHNVYEMGIAKAYLHWYEKGDYRTIDKIHDRLLGKSVERVAVSNDEGKPFVTETNVSPNAIKQIEDLLYADITGKRSKK
jgi:hypothetical protein